MFKFRVKIPERGSPIITHDDRDHTQFQVLEELLRHVVLAEGVLEGQVELVAADDVLATILQQKITAFYFLFSHRRTPTCI